MPERIQLSRKRGWRMPPNTRKADRSTKLGNPFKISTFKEARKAPRWWAVYGWDGIRSHIGSEAQARRIATDAFRDWVRRAELSEYNWSPWWRAKHRDLRAALDSGELRGVNLACWCPPGQACHVDVLLELANG